jgi:hypothetical protein
MSDDSRQTQFNEEETLAILEAERLGKPFPRFAATPLPKNDASASQREIEEIEDKRERNKVYQLGFWPDDKRAMPGDFIASAATSH